MLKQIRNKQAQAVMGEYVLVIFLVIAGIVSMAIYFKRAVQARIHDARDYMVSEVRTRTAGEYDGDLYLEYEPYYINTAATVTRDASDTKSLAPGASSGIFQKIFDETTSVQASSETAPPREFDRTTPQN